MSLDSLNLTISTITPPDGLAHTNRKQEILDLPTYLRVNANGAGSTLSVLVVQDLAPDPGDQDKIWVKTDTTTSGGVSQRGCYKYDAATGTWQLMAGIGIYVGSAAPSDTKVLWLNTAVAVTDTQQTGLYYYNGSAWIPIANPGLWVGTTAPTDTARPWLKTDDTTTCRGLYAYISAAWTLIAGTIITAASAPTGATGLLWLNSGAGGGLWRWTGAAWVNATAPLLTSGAQSQSVATGATRPSATERAYTLWAKTDAEPTGLFFWNGTAWESIGPITVQMRYPDLPYPGTVNVGTGYIAITGITYPSAVTFKAQPLTILTIEMDDLATGAHFWAGWGTSWGVIPGLSTYNLAFYNSEAARNMACRIGFTGIVLIP